MSFTVDVLRYGVQQVPGAQAFHQSDFDRWLPFDFHIFLLRDDDTVVLLDSGMDDPESLNSAIAASLGDRACITHLPTGGTVTELLGRHGLVPGDVDVVALTHLHDDHAGNVHLFTGARIAIGRRGWEAHLHRRKTHPGLVAPPAFGSTALAAMAVAEAEGRLLLVDDDEPVVPGLMARTIGGHTDDSTGYVVDSTAGRLVVPGDTVWTWANLERDVPVGSHVDVPACLDAMGWVRDAGDGVLPSHDPLIGERYADGRVDRPYR